eukprot:7221918-Alexandrium_andersonii.AAC.1
MCIRDRFPEQYFIASDEEDESDCPVVDGPARYYIGSDSEADGDGEGGPLNGEGPPHLGPGEGAWSPVRQRRRAGRAVAAATEAGDRAVLVADQGSLDRSVSSPPEHGRGG